MEICTRQKPSEDQPIFGHSLTTKTVIKAMQTRAAERLKANSAENLPEPVTKRIFKQLGLLFGNVFTNQFESEQQKHAAIKKWSEALAGVPLEMIALAFKKITHSGAKFPPTIPEFLKLCRPDSNDLGLPDKDQTYEMIIESLHLRQAYNQPMVEYLKKKYKHPFYRVVASQCNKSNLNTMSVFEAKRHIDQAHRKAIALVVLQPDLLQWPEAAIEKTKPKRSAPKLSAASAIAQMKKTIKSKG